MPRPDSLIPLALTKEQKQKIIDELREKIARQKAMAFVDFSGLKVKALTELRRKMKAAGCEFKATKKTLLSLVLKEKSLKIDPQKIEGEIALGFGYQDQIMPFKILYEFSKENENLKILGGLIDGEFIKKEKAIEVAVLPTREELLVKLAGSLSAPMANLVNALQGNLRNLVLVLGAIKK